MNKVRTAGMHYRVLLVIILFVCIRLLHTWNIWTDQTFTSEKWNYMKRRPHIVNDLMDRSLLDGLTKAGDEKLLGDVHVFHDKEYDMILYHVGFTYFDRMLFGIKLEEDCVEYYRLYYI